MPTITCGLAAGTMQILGGSGPALAAVFFQRTKLDRFQIVATRAALNVPLHLLRLLFVGLAIGSGMTTLSSSFPHWGYGAVVASAIVGNIVGSFILKTGFTDTAFLKWSWVLVLATSAYFLANGLWALLEPVW